MKIITAGKFPNTFPMRIRCKRIVDEYGFAYGEEKDFCGSELEIEMEDLKKHEWFKYPDYAGVDYGVVCPVCGKFISVDKKAIPDNVAANAQKVRLTA